MVADTDSWLPVVIKRDVIASLSPLPPGRVVMGGFCCFGFGCGCVGICGCGCDSFGFEGGCGCWSLESDDGDECTRVAATFSADI